MENNQKIPIHIQLKLTNDIKNTGYEMEFNLPTSTNNKFYLTEIDLTGCWYTPEKILLALRELNNEEQQVYTQYIIYKKVNNTQKYMTEEHTQLHSYTKSYTKRMFLSIKDIEGKLSTDILSSNIQINITY